MTLRDGNNPAIARAVTSCDSCLAWGLTYRQGVCAPCYSFASRYKTTAHCTACTRLRDGRRKYFSHRAEQGFTGRMLSIIGTTT